MVYKNILRYFSLLLGGLCVLVLCLTYRGTYNWVLYMMEWFCDYFLEVDLDQIWITKGYSYLLAPLPPYPIPNGGENCYMVTHMLQCMLMNLDFLFFLTSLAVLSSLYLIWFRERDWLFKMEDCWLLFLYPFYMFFCADAVYIWDYLPLDTLDSLWGCLLVVFFYLTLLLVPLLTVLIWKDRLLSLKLRVLLLGLVLIYAWFGWYLSFICLFVERISHMTKDFGEIFVTTTLLNHFGLGSLIAYCMTDYEIMVKYCKPQKEKMDNICNLAERVENLPRIPLNNKLGRIIGNVLKAGPILGCYQKKKKLDDCIERYKTWEKCKKDVEK